MAKRKKKTSPAAVRDIPYIRCYEEAGMIETLPGIFTHSYEIMPPRNLKELTFSAKKVRECMRQIYRSFGELSFQYFITYIIPAICKG